MWRFLAASVRGTSHIGQELPCQDSSIASLIDETLVLVASDGAGSALFSDEGSRLACVTVSQSITDFIVSGGSARDVNQNVSDLWIDAAVRALHLRATQLNQPVRELACTLLVCVLGPDASAYLQLGDGAIVGRYLDDYVAITWPSGGEYANTTFFLSDDRALEHFQTVFCAPAAEEVAVFTDGLQMLALQFETIKPHDPFFRPMFTRLRTAKSDELGTLEPALRCYLESPVVSQRTDDDKTLLLAARAQAL